MDQARTDAAHSRPGVAGASTEFEVSVRVNGTARLLRFDSRVTLLDALRAGATEAQVGQALAYAAALRITRFHTQNDFGDWDTVHHAFTAAHALHAALMRTPTRERVAEILAGALLLLLRLPKLRKTDQLFTNEQLTETIRIRHRGSTSKEDEPRKVEVLCDHARLD